jgi:hypothetical protein
VRKQRSFHSILLVLLAAGFLAGAVNLFLLRFEAGDVYPVYSSLRADPLGTKILYEGLEGIVGLTVSRNYRPLPKPGDNGLKTVLFPGTTSRSLEYVDEGEANALEALATEGGRLVILLYPERGLPPKKERNEASAGKKKEKAGEKQAQKKTGEEKDQDADDEEGGGEPRWVSLEDRWKFSVVRDEAPQKQDRDTRMTAVLATAAHGLPGSVTWHSGLSFKDPGTAWKTVYNRNGRPVLIERLFGRGSIVIATDTYFVSNEAMRKERNPDLLAWLVGGNSTVIFDETHFGIRENPGIAALGRKYRLTGVFGGVLLLALLFIWKNSAGLVPPFEDERRDREQGMWSGRDTLSGLSGLLRRTISGREILGVCFEEWKKSLPKGPGLSGDELDRAQKISDAEKNRPAKERDPVQAYRDISTLLSERKRLP